MHVPEDIHVDLAWQSDHCQSCRLQAVEETYHRLEHHEEMGVVMRVHRLAVVAQVLGAVHATEPLATDAVHAAITYRRGVQQARQVR